MPSVVDLSKPIAVVLREGTHEAHERAEHSRGAQWLTRGELDRDEYVRFLMMLWHVYDAFERALEHHATHPVLAPTHNPGLFARSANLAADISYILEVPESSWQSHPFHTALMTAQPPALSRYLARIQELAAGPDPSRLLAHAYVRYLGDLSGGQFIRRRIGKAYGLEEGVGGLSFYEFRTLTGAIGEGANAGEMKRIKEWYREGMNDGVRDNVDLKAAILEEANLAFEFNTALFDDLKTPSKPTSVATTVVLPSPLHSPVDSTSPSPPSTPFVEDMGDSPLLAPIKAQGGSKTIFEAAQPPSSTYAVTSVIAFIAAVSIAHFALVVGGFTGAKGFAKLELFTQWLDDFFASAPAQA